MLFSEDISLELPDSDIKYYPNFFKKEEADAYFNLFLKHVNWQQDDITVFGKTYKQPRLTALFGNNGKPYDYHLNTDLDLDCPDRSHVCEV